MMAMRGAFVTAGNRILPRRSPQMMSSLYEPRIEKKSFYTDESDEFARHRLNCSNALVKAHESKSFTEIVELPVEALQGIGPVHSELLEKLKIQSVSDLAIYRYYHQARALVTLAETEEENGRLEGSVMNVNFAVDKAWETATFQEIVEQPVSALQGLTNEKSDIWKQMGVSTIRDLGSFKYCQWAEAMVVASQCEETY